MIKVKVEVGLYSASYAMTGPARFTVSEVAVDCQEQPSIARVNVNWTRVIQLANTPPLQSTTLGLHPVNIHQTSPPVRGSKHSIVVLSAYPRVVCDYAC